MENWLKIVITNDSKHILSSEDIITWNPIAKIAEMK